MAEDFYYIDKEKLDQVVEFALAYRQGKVKPHINERFDIYEMMVRLYGLDAAPEVLDDGEFEALPSIMLYRGMPKAEYHANLLCDPVYHVGQGKGSNGIFAIPYERVAFNYTDPNGYSTKGVNRKPQNVLKFKLAPDAKIERLYGLRNEFLSFNDARPAVEELKRYIDENVPADAQKFIFRMFCDDAGKIAAVAGIDVIEGAFGIKAILNRAKIVVSQSELERIKSLSRGRGHHYEASGQDDEDNLE